MTPYLLDVPLVVVHNYLENFREFLSRTGGSDVLMARRFNGDQALFWYGKEKLVISSALVENAEVLKERWGYQDTHLFYPDEPSAELSLDIVNSPRLRAEIVAYAGEKKEIALISYAATPELYELTAVLEKEEGLNVQLPEAPEEENLWIKRYIDTKLGFRILVGDWLSDENPLPLGFITVDASQVADMVGWFASEEKGCVVKADEGGSGVGNLFLPLKKLRVAKNHAALLDENEFLDEGVFIVEELIPSEEQISPSLEFYVPPFGSGEPKLTYLCNQHFEESGRFAGVVIGKELYDASWYSKFESMGLTVAAELQEMGYVGHFDLDAILNDYEDVFLVEINSRRTGGTYAHEFLQTRFGENYANQMTMISQNKMNSKFTTLSELEGELQDLIYPMNGKEQGVILMLTSTLFRGNFGFIILGESINHVVKLREQLVNRI